MKKVLITGIDSFTGNYLSKYLLNAGYNVYGTSLFQSGNKKFKCDITKKNDILNVLKDTNPDFLIHLSGISFAAHGNNEDFYKVNTIGTINLLESCLDLDIHPNKILIASSATVYGNQGLEILDESLCCKPANHYGASKYAMECLVEQFFSKLPILITRPFNYTGIGQAEHFLIPKIVKHFKENKQEIELGNINVIREFNNIDFICESYQKLLECNEKSQVINIASNKGIKLLDVIDMMNNIAGYNINVKVNQKFVRKDEIKKLTGSNEKLFSIIKTVKQKDFKNTLEAMYKGI